MAHKAARRGPIEHAVLKSDTSRSGISTYAWPELSVAKCAISPFGVLNTAPYKCAGFKIGEYDVRMIERRVVKFAFHKLRLREFSMLENTLCPTNLFEI